jgi:tetratricopeptide (TPR) repeat protein
MLAFAKLFSQTKTADYYFQIANNYFDKSEYTLAIPYCDSTILMNPEHSEAYAFRGVCNFNLKNYEEAIADFNLALILVPGYAEVYYFRGFCYKETQQDKLACDDWTMAYNLGLKKAMKLIIKHCEIEEKPKNN